MILLFILSCAQQTVTKRAVTPDSYFPSATCRNCHERAYEQHLTSMHSRSYSNEAFQSQYFNEVIPLSMADEDVQIEAARCLACHNPIAYLTQSQPILSKEQGDLVASNVTCDFCHTIVSYKGETPGGANYVIEPGEIKYGPHRTKTQWHHRYNSLFKKSEFCGICHNGTNHKGVETKSTYTEWKESTYAKKGIQCQDCHMNAIGFIENSKPIFESGQAASIRVVKPPHRANLHTHTFPGSSRTRQIIGATKLKIYTQRTSVVPGETVEFTVFVDNRRTGHKMPSGHTDWRLMWLEVSMSNGRETTSLMAGSEAAEGLGYDVAGQSQWDAEILGKEIPAGSRIYRQVFLDSAGKQTLRAYQAARIAFDNRLDAAEMRKEKFRIRIPETKGPLYILATLNYLIYPGKVAESLGIAHAEKIVLATASRELSLE
ncbi:multiheme c-type cytochrome [Nitrospirota bacterium]